MKAIDWLRPLSALALLATACPAMAATNTDDGAQAPPAKCVQAAGVEWIADYYAAYRKAADEKKLLVVQLTPGETSRAQETADRSIAERASLVKKLSEVVRCRLPVDATIDVDGKPERLAGFSVFRELHGGAGVVMIDLSADNPDTFRQAVSALPLASGKYYRWSAEGLETALDLPLAPLSQRTMIWAVRMHPERPQSTGGQLHPVLADGATSHARYQARVQQQGHQNFSTRSRGLSAAAGSMVSEVCAESWPNQNLIDSCLDCVASWRHSSGHWRGVSGAHRAYGYDIRRGRNGIWYGVGIFTD